jgi:dolichyl-phosphate-mannose--protein O-mannosyl transferase
VTTIQYICPSESQSYLYIYIMCKQCFIYHCLLVCPITFLVIALSVRLQFTTSDISKRFFFSVGCQHDLYMYIYLYGSLSKYTSFSIITQLIANYQPKWLDKTYFARRPRNTKDKTSLRVASINSQLDQSECRW